MLGADVTFALVRPDDAEAAEPETFRGRIGFVSPEIDPVTRQVRVWAEIDNTDNRLRPGAQGQLLIPR